MPAFLATFLSVIHVLVCLFLMLVVLLQQGKGGGMGAAFGGGAAQQVFGGRGAGNLLTRATAICAGIFMLTSVVLAWNSSAGDRALKARAKAEEAAQYGNKGMEGAPREKASATPSAAAPAPSGDTPPPAPASSTPQ
jgi:preprotein translocase subunit SecG